MGLWVYVWDFFLLLGFFYLRFIGLWFFSRFLKPFLGVSTSKKHFFLGGGGGRDHWLAQKAFV